MYKQIFSKPFFILVASIFALLAFLVSPPFEYDLYRHFERIKSISSLNFSEVIPNSKMGYYLFDIYAWITQSLSFSIHFIPASIVFAGYFLYFIVFQKLIANNTQKIQLSTLFFILITFLLSINFISLTSGLRSGLATSLLIYITFELYTRRQITLFIIGSIFAFFIHPFAIAISSIVIIPLLFPVIKYFRKPIIILSIIALLGTNVITVVLSNLETLLRNLSFYHGQYLSLTGEWGAAYIQKRNLNGIIGDFVITRLPIYIAFIYLILSRRISNYPIYIVLILISLYLGLFFSYYTLFDRMASFYILLFTVYISYQFLYFRNSFNKYFLLVYLSSLVAYSIYNLYNYRRLLLSIFTSN